MNELQYNICEDEIKKLVKARFKNDQEIKKNFLKRAVLSGILIGIVTFFITRTFKFAFKISMGFVVGSVLIFVLLLPVARFIGCIMSTKEYLNRMNPYINQKVYIKFNNKKIEIERQGSQYSYGLEECEILCIDEERVYIKFSDNTMIYVPKKNFANKSQVEMFINLLEK